MAGGRPGSGSAGPPGRDHRAHRPQDDHQRAELRCEDDAAFYLWLDTHRDDAEFTRGLYQQHNVSVLPGSYLAREARGVNPGSNFVRVALVSSTAECAEAAQRIAAFFRNR